MPAGPEPAGSERGGEPPSSPKAPGCSCFGLFAARPSQPGRVPHQTHNHNLENSSRGHDQPGNQDTLGSSVQEQQQLQTQLSRDIQLQGTSTASAAVLGGSGTSVVSNPSNRKPHNTASRKSTVTSATRLKPPSHFGIPSLAGSALSPHGSATALDLHHHAANIQHTLLLELLNLPTDSAVPASRQMALLANRLGVSWACLTVQASNGRCYQQQGAAYLNEAAKPATSTHVSGAAASLAGISSSGLGSSGRRMGSQRQQRGPPSQSGSESSLAGLPSMGSVPVSEIGVLMAQVGCGRESICRPGSSLSHFSVVTA